MRLGVQPFFVCRLEHLQLDNRSGPEFADPSRGGYDLDRIAIEADGSIRVDLKPAALKAFIEANWVALTDAVDGVELGPWDVKVLLNFAGEPPMDR